MTALTWDKVGERFFETGVDRGVLYIPDNNGVYNNGVAWNGLVSVSESPSGAEPNAQYADNIKYLNLYSAEEFGATIEAFTYPDEFSQFDGLSVPTPGVSIGQQHRGMFGLSYRTRIGNDIQGDDLGYKLHLIYGCQASPSEKAYNTVNDSPEALTFSWEIATTPVSSAGRRPTSIVTVDSRKVDSAKLTDLTNLLWGTVGSDPSLPLPDAVISILTTGLTLATPLVPVYTDAAGPDPAFVTIPTVTGVDYYVNGILAAPGDVDLTQGTPILVAASPKPGYKFPQIVDTDWLYEWEL